MDLQEGKIMLEYVTLHVSPSGVRPGDALLDDREDVICEVASVVTDPETGELTALPVPCANPHKVAGVQLTPGTLLPVSRRKD
jgi:hypothetical protein